MANRTDLSDYLDTLHAYIKERTTDGSWCPLTYRDISRLTGLASGSSIVKRLFEQLKNHESLDYKIDNNPSKSKKPLMFRYVTREQKYDSINTRTYTNLSSDELDYIKEKIKHKDISFIVDTLTLCNYLKGISIRGSADKEDTSTLSDKLMISEKTINSILDNLENLGIIVDLGLNYRLVFHYTDIQETEVQSKAIEDIPSRVPKEIRPMYDMLSTVSILLTAHKKEIEDLRAREKELQLQLEEGHLLTQDVLKENAMLKDENKELKLSYGKCESSLERTAKKQEAYLMALQENIQIFISQVTIISSDDYKASLSEKNNHAYRSLLLKKYTDAANELYAAVLNTKTE